MGRYVSSPLIVGDEWETGFSSIPQTNTRVRVHTHYTGINATHPEGIDGMFSLDDVCAFVSWNESMRQIGATDPDDITAMVIGRAGAYAMRIKDPLKAQQFLTNYKDPNALEEGEVFKVWVDKKFDKIYEDANRDCRGTCNDEAYAAFVEKYFITFMNKIDAGIYMYYAMPIIPNSVNSTYSWYSF